MITENDRVALIQYRLNQADETIELTKFLLESKKLGIAVNRIYYGLFYALTALALKYGFETSKHGQLIGWFNKEFVLSKKVDAQYGRILRNDYQNQIKGQLKSFA